MTKTTLELLQGDRVILPGRLERTVESVVPSEYLNRDNGTIYYVYYAEGRTHDWSAGNSAIGSTVWQVAS